MDKEALCAIFERKFFFLPQKGNVLLIAEGCTVVFFPHRDGHLASLGSSFSYVVWGMTVPNHVYSSASQNGPQMCRAQRDSAL